MILEKIQDIKYEFDVIERGIIENRIGYYNGLSYQQDISGVRCLMDFGGFSLHLYELRYKKEGRGFSACDNDIDVDMYVSDDDYRFQIDSCYGQELYTLVRQNLFKKMLMPYGYQELSLLYIPKKDLISDTSLGRRIEIYKQHNI